MRIFSRLLPPYPKRSQGWEWGCTQTRMLELYGISLNQIRLKTYTLIPHYPAETASKYQVKSSRTYCAVALDATQSVIEILSDTIPGKAAAYKDTSLLKQTDPADYTEFHLAKLGLPDNIVHDHHLFSASTPTQPTLLIAAAREETVAARLAQAATFGLKVHYLDIDILALANAVLFSRRPSPLAHEIIFCLEPERVHMLAFSHGRLTHLQQTALAGDNQEDTATTAVSAHHTAACREALYLLQLYQHTHHHHTPPEISLTGTLSQAAHHTIAQATGLPVNCRHPVHSINPDIPAAEAACLSTVFGLALKPFIATARHRHTHG